MKPKNIFLIRHGQSEGNVDKRVYQKKPDYAIDLTPEGHAQAVECGKRLLTLTDRKLAVYYSPMFRTVQTLNGIASAFPTKFFKADKLREEPRLREQEWSGRLPADGYDAAAEDERDQYGVFYYRFHGGESCADVYDRVSDFMDTLHRDFAKDSFNEDVVIVSHGMTIRVFLQRWFHRTVSDFEHWHNPSNCQILQLTLGDNGKYNFDFDSIKIRKPLHNYKTVLTVPVADE